MRHDFVEKHTYVAYACRDLHQIGLVKGQFLGYSWFSTRDIPKITGTGAECRVQSHILERKTGASKKEFYPEKAGQLK